MVIQETNFVEIVLRNVMIGKTIYEDFGAGPIPIVIRQLIYDPLTEQIYISDNVDPDHVDANNYKMSIKENFDFDYDTIKKIKPNKKKIKGKRKR